jgi:hypothetical protein
MPMAQRPGFPDGRGEYARVYQQERWIHASGEAIDFTIAGVSRQEGIRLKIGRRGVEIGRVYEGRR